MKKKKDEEEEALYNFPLPPITCCQCLEILNSEEVVVYTEHGGQAHLWHPKCFVCHTCEELLVDLIYFFHKEKVYCGRHYADIVKIPRCNACDEVSVLVMFLIFNFLSNMNSLGHSGTF